MSAPANSLPSGKRLPGVLRNRIQVVVAIAGIAAFFGFLLVQRPRFELIAQSPLVVQAHLAAAVFAFGLGAVLLAWRKGRTFHRVFGWLWVTMIGTVIASSFFILDEDTRTFSWIHVSSAVHAVTLTMAVLFIRQRNVKWHRRLMILTYVSGLTGAMALAFIPDRLMWQVFFG